MTKLRTYLERNYNLDAEVAPHLNSIIADMEVELERGDYDDDFGRVSECTICEVFDEKLYDRLNTTAATEE